MLGGLDPAHFTGDHTWWALGLTSLNPEPPLLLWGCTFDQAIGLPPPCAHPPPETPPLFCLAGCLSRARATGRCGGVVFWSVPEGLLTPVGRQVPSILPPPPNRAAKTPLKPCPPNQSHPTPPSSAWTPSRSTPAPARARSRATAAARRSPTQGPACWRGPAPTWRRSTRRGALRGGGRLAREQGLCARRASTFKQSSRPDTSARTAPHDPPVTRAAPLHQTRRDAPPLPGPSPPKPINHNHD